MIHWATRGTPSGWHFVATPAVVVAAEHVAAEATEQHVVAAFETAAFETAAASILETVVAATPGIVVAVVATDPVAVAGATEGLRLNGCPYPGQHLDVQSQSAPHNGKLSKIFCWDKPLGRDDA